jgi:arylsulfatase A-like enzyme
VLGNIVEAFRVRGLIDNTLFVFVGDHGESFGEHGAYVHNNSLYEEEIAVPLVFWSSDGRLRHPDTLVARQVDIAPTVADLMGLENPDFETQGVSLLRTTTCPPVYVGTFFEAVSQALVIDRTKYMFWPSSDRLVRFDLARDPAEVAPMDVHGPERRDILKRLHAAEAYERRIWGP